MMPSRFPNVRQSTAMVSALTSVAMTGVLVAEEGPVPTRNPPASGTAFPVHVSADRISSVPVNGRLALSLTAGIGKEDFVDKVCTVYMRLLAYLSTTAYPHLWYVWNLLPQIDRYGEFNEGRARAYARHAIAAPGFPAATVVGTTDNVYTIYALAGARPGQFMENPRQVSAFNYPVCYSRQVPQFARAVRVDWGHERRLLLSGTASIVGHASQHVNDLATQTAEIFNNISAMTDTIGPCQPLSLNAYVRGAPDAPVVLEQIQRMAPGATWCIRQAEMCRPELLVEINGVWAC